MRAQALQSMAIASGLLVSVAACRDATNPEMARLPAESTVSAKKAPPPPPPPPPDVTAPTTPVFSATDVGPTHISLAWSSTDDRGGSIYYVIYVNGAQDPNGGTSSTSRTFYLLQPATTYTFTGKARDNSGNWSPVSGPFAVTTKPRDANDTQAPTTPTNVFAGGYGDGSTEFEVSWTASTDNVDAQAFIRYDVYLNGELSDITVGKTRSTNYGVVGTNTISAIAVDAAGNRSPAGTTTLVIQL